MGNLDVIDPAALEPGQDWPELFGSYREMLAAVGPDAALPPGAAWAPRPDPPSSAGGDSIRHAPHSSGAVDGHD
ncbi:hypothetical protein [Micromonospora sp. WMMD1082]|uniref:hypothetical protein n=1 Tax=Micromonospora sp. WMMD1082 TaxID=3016104 RepID=UPI002416050C|nr:hypothetical protein [Micromonospora sp. WMMD1082]MDG4795447.1 hypothetical protein [Micromonospora sp. WMMD1082]